MKKASSMKFHIVLVLILITLTSNAYGRDIFGIHIVYPYIGNIHIENYKKFIRGKHDFPPFVWVHDKVEIDISYLKSASYEPDEAKTNRKSNFLKAGHKITFVFNPKGTKKFSTFTKKISGRRIAILVDGKLLSVPVIFSEISDGVAIVTSTLPQTEVEAMVKKINEGISQNRF